ncbi:MAG: mechanosensitive ion channel [Planctomycetales bacterium]|nr:mechanosensitive ion channel [Planctomycetales bacterium]
MISVVALMGQPLSAQESPSQPAQEAVEPTEPTDSTTETNTEQLKPASEVKVDAVADDAQIENRLRRILTAAGWFENVDVTVEEGLVTLRGLANRPEQREWAEELATNTEDVVEVINHMKVREKPLWDLTPAFTETRNLARDVITALPLAVVGAVLMLLAWGISHVVMRTVSRVLERRGTNALLRGVITKTASIPILLLGAYLVLRIAGLTQMALTVLGGTGLFGLVVGIAFRDIAENFLASILVSTQRPFVTGDLIEVSGVKGFVQAVTTRGTQLLTAEGNHVHIPNSTIYKNVIWNFTANPQRRSGFSVGIDYDSNVLNAQEVVLKVLTEHAAVLNDPEPLVLVDELGASSVKLSVLYWIDANQHSDIKVKSALLRLTKNALIEAGVGLPDEGREIIFPQGVPVILERERSQDDVNGEDSKSQRTGGNRATRDGAHHTSRRHAKSTAESHEPAIPVGVAEGGLQSERDEIQRQAENSRPLDDGANLLRN